jgi:hypothetical protein
MSGAIYFGYGVGHPTRHQALIGDQAFHILVVQAACAALNHVVVHLILA